MFNFITIPNICDGDASEKTHSRSTWRQALSAATTNDTRQLCRRVAGIARRRVRASIEAAEPTNQAHQVQIYYVSPSPLRQLAVVIEFVNELPQHSPVEPIDVRHRRRWCGSVELYSDIKAQSAPAWGSAAAA
ncbi:hypothetical protein PHLGIDRAFT_117657 [Phlebiopsis gigantea 11061_1 CR5-6]|uniref:Uncharacterized protein n=1 Tax=Phlebiopsis gigantea (strain 11061_1 CR5-6) TaxID=745531 RepID=A0A0C3S953_PHLG1|nr:hypothetical protein PHLGIDRAFT_117657 [Phlebiopsis gigantea 11061_1 CR5-6]